MGIFIRTYRVHEFIGVEARADRGISFDDLHRIFPERDTIPCGWIELSSIVPGHEYPFSHRIGHNGLPYAKKKGQDEDELSIFYDPNKQGSYEHRRVPPPRQGVHQRRRASANQQEIPNSWPCL